MAYDKGPCGLYYKQITNLNDASLVVRMKILDDTTTWSITCDSN